MVGTPGAHEGQDASAAAALALPRGAHPDVVERLLVVAPRDAVPVDGDPAVAARPDGRAFAFAAGTGTIVLRLGSEPAVDLAALDASPWGDVPGWWACSAWLTEIPTAAGLERLREACAAAFAVAGA